MNDCYDRGGNFHVYNQDELNRLCMITVGLEKELEDFHERGEVDRRENLDSINKCLEQLKDPRKTKGFTSIPYLSDLVRKVKKSYNLN